MPAQLPLGLGDVWLGVVWFDKQTNKQTNMVTWQGKIFTRRQPKHPQRFFVLDNHLLGRRTVHRLPSIL